MVAAQVEMAKKALAQKLATATTPKRQRAKVSKYPGARLRQLRAERGVGRPVYDVWTATELRLAGQLLGLDMASSKSHLV